jgi:hypothetical protein
MMVEFLVFVDFKFSHINFESHNHGFTLPNLEIQNTTNIQMNGCESN